MNATQMNPMHDLTNVVDESPAISVPTIGGGIGCIFWNRQEKDRYDNEVTIIEMPDGHKYRMVHHSKTYHVVQKATIYSGRGRFIRVKYHKDGNYIDIAGYEAVRNVHNTPYVVMNHDGMERKQEIINAIFLCEPGNFRQVILTVLLYAEVNRELWETKEVIAK